MVTLGLSGRMGAPCCSNGINSYLLISHPDFPGWEMGAYYRMGEPQLGQLLASALIRWPQMGQGRTACAPG